MKLAMCNLTDDSYYLCSNIKIPLIHLRTMLKGEPFYCKYGFRPNVPNEYNIYKSNKKIFLSRPSLTKDEIIKFIMFRKFNSKNKTDNHILNYINNILIPRLTATNLISNFLNVMINDNTEESAYLLYNIYMNIFEKIGYQKYMQKSFDLYIDKYTIK